MTPGRLYAGNHSNPGGYAIQRGQVATDDPTGVMLNGLAGFGDGTDDATHSKQHTELVAPNNSRLSGNGTTMMPLAELRPADSPRLVGEDEEHIRILAESDRTLPPILVHRPSMRVIDGMHRLGAARLRGQDTTEVVFFDGSEEDAFLLAVKANMAHGLPLSYADREAAVARIVVSHPDWSDRAIAATTGLAPRTVAAVRGRIDGLPPETARVGRDGRVRPLNGTDGRLVASRLIAAHPNASLREIARGAGISPTTVRDVRERIQRGEDPVRLQRSRPRPRTAAPRDGEPVEPARPPSEGLTTRERDQVLSRLERDPSLRFAQSGHMVLRWLARRLVTHEEWQDVAEAAPPHTAYIIAAVARRCAGEWLEFARQLEKYLGE
jgi:ParB-like chromosome segregation protein Spo0J